MDFLGSLPGEREAAATVLSPGEEIKVFKTWQKD